MLLRAALGPTFSVGMVGPNKELGGWGLVYFAYSGLVDCLDGFLGTVGLMVWMVVELWAFPKKSVQHIPGCIFAFHHLQPEWNEPC